MLKELQSLLGTIAIASAGAGSFLVLLDWFLPKTSKRWIEDKVSTLWLWLSYQQTLPLMRLIQKPRAFSIFLLIGILLLTIVIEISGILFFHWVVPERNRPSAWALYSGGFLGSLIFQLPGFILLLAARRVLRRGYIWLTSASNNGVLLIRSLLICAVLSYLFGSPLNDLYFGYQHTYGGEDLSKKFTERLVEGFSSPGFGTSLTAMKHYFEFAANYPITAVIFLIVTLFVTISMFQVGALLAYSMTTVAVYILAIYSLSFAHRALQTGILKLLEYERGPVLGVAALLAAFGAFCKFMGGQS